MNMAAGEECDEFDTWEEMEDAGVLDKKIEKLKAAMSSSMQKGLRNDINSDDKSGTVVILAEDGRTRYVPPERTVKILKRPSAVNNSHNAGGDGFIVNGDNSGKPKQPIKTLQQREMEYAEARLRILGEAQSPDERPALLERIRRIQNKIESVPEPFEQNILSPTSNLTINSTSAAVMTTIGSPPVINTSPIIMASTQSQINLGNTCAPGTGVINVTANYGGTTGLYNNNIINNQLIHQQQQQQQQQPNVAGYAFLNHHHLHHHHHHFIYPNHYQHMNNSSPLQNSSLPSFSPVTAAVPVTSSPNNASSPHNLVIRQPKGPDGTKGFQLRTLR